MKETRNIVNSPSVDKVGIEDRVYRITKRSVKKEAKLQGLKMALSMIDLTTLEGADTVNLSCQGQYNINWNPQIMYKIRWEAKRLHINHCEYS